MINKNYLYRLHRCPFQPQLRPNLQKEREKDHPEVPSTIFDVGFILATSPAHTFVRKSPKKDNRKIKNSTESTQQPLTPPAKCKRTPKIELTAETSYSKRPSFCNNRQLSLELGSKQPCIHSRRITARKASPSGQKRKTISYEQEPQNDAKEKVKARIISGQAMLSFAKTNSAELKDRVEGRHLTYGKYGSGHATERRTHSKISSRTIDYSKTQRSTIRKEVATSGPRVRPYRPWSPEMIQNDSGVVFDMEYFVSTPL